ncbi:hypothetical protein ANN_26281 [Periplaneta americana]|uniref:Uncharacterized protein n=1 Tax=Periplaneta americana TaxID=6978 RepID=A0ABQ8S5U9_PERAM|nr:hypothetical protein ANN_26281 [Periplaneta americana]
MVVSAAEGRIVSFSMSPIIRKPKGSCYYQPVLEMLFSEFETRFHDINDMNVEMLIFENPFAVKPEEAPLTCQLEIVDMQNT